MGSLSIIWPWKLVTSSMTTESKGFSAIHRQSYALRVFRAYRWRSTNRVMHGHVRVRFECSDGVGLFRKVKIRIYSIGPLQ